MSQWPNNNGWKMDPQLKQEWVDALESGEYNQGKGSLKDKKGNYCCLGVLGCVLIKKQPDVYRFEKEILVYEGENIYEVHKFIDEESGDSGDTLLPDLTGKKLHISFKTQDHLSVLNDGKEEEDGTIIPPLSFKEIAELIKTNL